MLHSNRVAALPGILIIVMLCAVFHAAPSPAQVPDIGPSGPVSPTEEDTDSGPVYSDREEDSHTDTTVYDSTLNEREALRLKQTADYFLKISEFDKAIENYEQALRYSPSDPAVVESLRRARYLKSSSEGRIRKIQRDTEELRRARKQEQENAEQLDMADQLSKRRARELTHGLREDPDARAGLPGMGSGAGRGARDQAKQADYHGKLSIGSDEQVKSESLKPFDTESWMVFQPQNSAVVDLTHIKGRRGIPEELDQLPEEVRSEIAPLMTEIQKLKAHKKELLEQYEKEKQDPVQQANLSKQIDDAQSSIDTATVKIENLITIHLTPPTSKRKGTKKREPPPL